MSGETGSTDGSDSSGGADPSGGPDPSGDADRSPPRTLSRVQVYLYAVLSLFVGTVLVNLADPVTGGLPRGESLLVYAVVGLAFGLVVAFAAVYAVVRRVRSLPSEARYRLERLHTVALTAFVLGFLLLISVDPSLVGGGSGTPTDRFVPLPSNLVSVLPLVAAAATLVALGAYRYRRGRRAGTGVQ